MMTLLSLTLAMLQDSVIKQEMVTTAAILDSIVSFRYLSVVEHIFSWWMQ